MKKLIPSLLALAVCAWAADFWQAKPFTEWNDKEVQKLLSNSPWAREVSVPMAMGGGGGTGKGGGKRGGGGGDGGDVPLTGPASGGGGNLSPRAGTQDVGGGGTPASAPTMTLTISWRTALPVRQAVAKQKFGADAGTSPDAKKMIEEPQKYYAVLVSGFPGRMAQSGDRMKEELLKNTTLAIKGKDSIAPADIQSGGNERTAAVLFLFPKTAAIDADDKEVEFTTHLGPIMVKQKFKLKEMVVNGKLEL
jgi:hypothetical protein